MRAIYDVFVLLRHTLELRDDVPGIHAANCGLYGDIRLGVQRHWPEFLRRRRLAQRIPVLARGTEQLLRLVERDPSLDWDALIGVGRDDVQLLAGPARLDDIPS